MKKTNEESLPDSAFVVLAIIAEGETHGYGVQKIVHERGFQFWTSIKRSSAYNALVLLEKAGLITSKTIPGEGPDKKVYRITEAGRQRLVEDGSQHLSAPAHPKSEIDLGVYSIPFMPKKLAKEALDRYLAHMNDRKSFLEERLAWCRSKNLRMPALAFERPLLLLKAEIEWAKKLREDFEGTGKLKVEDWKKYEYRKPPHAKED